MSRICRNSLLCELRFVVARNSCALEVGSRQNQMIDAEPARAGEKKPHKNH